MAVRLTVQAVHYTVIWAEEVAGFEPGTAGYHSGVTTSEPPLHPSGQFDILKRLSHCWQPSYKYISATVC
jgi:hypothetical protein